MEEKNENQRSKSEETKGCLAMSGIMLAGLLAVAMVLMFTVGAIESLNEISGSWVLIFIFILIAVVVGFFNSVSKD